MSFTDSVLNLGDQTPRDEVYLEFYTPFPRTSTLRPTQGRSVYPGSQSGVVRRDWYRGRRRGPVGPEDVRPRVVPVGRLAVRPDEAGPCLRVEARVPFPEHGSERGKTGDGPGIIGLLLLRGRNPR